MPLLHLLHQKSNPGKAESQLSIICCKNTEIASHGFVVDTALNAPSSVHPSTKPSQQTMRGRCFIKEGSLEDTLCLLFLVLRARPLP
jgi:hypothetical protein